MSDDGAPSSPTEQVRSAVSERSASRRRLAWLIGRATLLLGIIAAIVYWVRFSPVPVTAVAVGRGTIVAEVFGTGTLEARLQASISPKISGRIREVLVDQGDQVGKGQLLARLDDEELKQQVAVAKAGVAAAQASIDRLAADRRRVEAIVVQAKRKHDRVKLLAGRNAATEGALDEAVEGLAIGEADISRAEAALVEGRQHLVAAQETLRFHEARRSDTQISAPFDGLIVRRQREPGDVVVPGTAMLTLISTEELWVSAWVDETEMDRLSSDLPARVVFRSEPDQSWPGQVARLGREADRETREFIVDVFVKELPQNWAVGQRAEVYIETDRREDVVVLSADQLLKKNGRPGVYVRNANYAAWREISIGIRSTDTVEVTDGLKPGDIVLKPLGGEPDSLGRRRIDVR